MQVNLEYKQEKKIFSNSIWSFRLPEKPLFMGFSAIFHVPGHTTLSSKGKIQYPHYPHIPLQSHTAKPSGTAAQFHSTFRSGNPDNPTSIASHITVSSYTAALSQCHFRSIIQSITHTLQHQEISTFRSVTHALVVSQQTHAVAFRLLLFYTESCKIQRGFLQLFPISRCLFTPHFIWVRILCDRGINDKKEQQQSYATVLLSVADRIIIFAFYRIIDTSIIPIQSLPAAWTWCHKLRG